MSLATRIRAFGLAWAVLVLDFATKRIVLANKQDFAAGIPLIDGYLQFTYVRNAGAAFGMFQGGRWPFIVVSAVTVVLLTYVLVRGRTHGLRAYAYAMILAGAAGNLIDRIFYDGLVVDFILMSYRDSSFPVYNVADMGVTFGAVLLVLSMFHGERSQPASTTTPLATDPATGSATSPSSSDVRTELDP
jgi:signal peptidase II